ncbi:hypothetical protein [Roseateles sp.]|uniref:hypothetical protein n=1 Tax=Roseateles sp. TaxID=1971397 RepID=UPI0025FDD446|nr:hypothetical protein [Roseateles sp.]MBV8036902.1 hypothetical protein [Roseateles sp.]
MASVHRSLGFANPKPYLLIRLQPMSFTLLARLLTPQQNDLYSLSTTPISMVAISAS